MIITSAILEFFVLGCLWICAFLLATFILMAGWSGVWPQLDLGDAQPLVTLVGIPVTYAVGVVLQAATWRFFYKRVHSAALEREVNGSHREAYVRLADEFRRRGVEIGLNKGELKTGKHLGGLHDALRWELLASSQSGPAQQYLIQFHLYRILYGSIPPLFFISVVLTFGISWFALRTGSGALVLAFVLAALFSWVLTVLAFFGAAHRRARTWKFLVFGVQAQRART